MLPSVVPAAQLPELAAAYDRAFAAGTEPDRRYARSGGNVRLAALVTRDAAFHALYVLVQWAHGADPVRSTWHGYSRNDSAGPRRSIQGAYIPSR